MTLHRLRHSIMRSITPRIQLLAATLSLAILFTACEGIVGPAGADGADGNDGTPATPGATCTFNNQCDQGMYCYYETRPVGNNAYSIDREGTCQSPFPVNSKCYLESHCYPLYCTPNEIPTSQTYSRVLHLNQTCKTEANTIGEGCFISSITIPNPDCASGYCDTFNHICSDGQIDTACGGNNDCASGYCDQRNNVCTDGSVGRGCLVNSNCASDTCTSNVCE